MFSFIPSWYGKDGGWVRNAKVWYRTGEQLGFDDIVNQIKMFRMAGEDVEIILLGCMPELRFFLHREGIDEVKVRSVFDMIQNIKGNTALQIRLSDYPWPEDIEWVYTPFLKLGYRNGKLYSRAEFNEEGYWIETEIYKNNEPDRILHIDDRGFVSYVEQCRNGIPEWRFFLDRKGRWQIKEDLKRKNVYVNPAVSGRFDRSSYRNLGELIEEVFGKILRDCSESSLIVAFDEKHNEIVRRKAGGRKTAYSVFSQRTKKPVPSMLEGLVQEKRLLVTDTEYLAHKIKDMFPQYADKVMDLSPYDARLALGKSSGIMALKILFYVDADEFEGYEAALSFIFKYMDENRKAFLTIGIGRNNTNPLAVDGAKADMKRFMYGAGIKYRIEEENEDIAENETEAEAEPRIAVIECRSETQIIHVLADHRIIVDLGSTPDLYLQIAGISAGLPLVLNTESQYVSHRENGWILKSASELEEALRYYLSGLSNWNQSLIWSLRRISEYTNGTIVDRWKRAMNSLTNGSDRS